MTTQMYYTLILFVFYIAIDVCSTEYFNLSLDDKKYLLSQLPRNHHPSLQLQKIMRDSLLVVPDVRTKRQYYYFPPPPPGQGQYPAMPPFQPPPSMMVYTKMEHSPFLEVPTTPQVSFHDDPKELRINNLLNKLKTYDELYPSTEIAMFSPRDDDMIDRKAIKPLRSFRPEPPSILSGEFPISRSGDVVAMLPPPLAIPECRLTTGPIYRAETSLIQRDTINSGDLITTTPKSMIPLSSSMEIPVALSMSPCNQLLIQLMLTNVPGCARDPNNTSTEMITTIITTSTAIIPTTSGVPTTIRTGELTLPQNLSTALQIATPPITSIPDTTLTQIQIQPQTQTQSQNQTQPAREQIKIPDQTQPPPQSANPSTSSPTRQTNPVQAVTVTSPLRIHPRAEPHVPRQAVQIPFVPLPNTQQPDLNFTIEVPGQKFNKVVPLPIPGLISNETHLVDPIDKAICAKMSSGSQIIQILPPNSPMFEVPTASQTIINPVPPSSAPILEVPTTIQTNISPVLPPSVPMFERSSTSHTIPVLVPSQTPPAIETQIIHTTEPPEATENPEVVKEKLNVILHSLESLKHTNPKHAEGFPCSFQGRWTSTIAGVSMHISQEDGFEVDVPLTALRTSSGFFNGVDGWVAKFSTPLGRQQLLSVTAINIKTQYTARFIGECRVCNDEEIMSGHWLVMKPENCCAEMTKGQDYYGDVWLRCPDSNSMR